MSITKQPPKTIYLGGPRTEVNDLACSEAITPGHLIERFNSTGTIRFRKATFVGSGERAPIIVANDQPMLNKGVDTAYATNDLVEASVGAAGSVFWMLVPSGETIVAGDKLASNGAGLLVKRVAPATALFTALENVTAVATTRIRAEAL